MNHQHVTVMHECSAGSIEGRLSFPQVVANLTEIGIESYHADLRRQEKTYYFPSGESHVEHLPIEPVEIGTSFLASNVEAAVRLIQRDVVSYREFLRQIMAAGCVGYVVSIPGKRAVYSGRNADACVEPFPSPR